ncbi:MAG: type I methionyl aminopeptidase [Acidobacteria bacterium]|nr:MAG: type I methionyl aminopeptidase [Acidobacteriota bacterium]
MKVGRNDPCFCGSGKKYKRCHGKKNAPAPVNRKVRSIRIMSSPELVEMRRSCTLAANILEKACRRIQPGVSTQDIDDWVLELTLEAGAYPAPLNYPNAPTNPRKPIITKGGFPKSVCTSVNEVVCHGIPSEKQILKDGDIVNVDVTCNLNGFFGDTSRTVYVGQPGKEARLVTETARKCLQLGIEAARPYKRLVDIGQVIHEYATSKGLGVVREYTGHGIGTTFHAEPQVCHYPNRSTDCEIRPGMTFTIEPMINIGTWKTQLDPTDGWTVYTLDRKLSAQFEHTILITHKGPEILTIPTV